MAARFKSKDGAPGGDAAAASLVCRVPEPLRTERLLNEVYRRLVVPEPYTTGNVFILVDPQRGQFIGLLCGASH